MPGFSNRIPGCSATSLSICPSARPSSGQALVVSNTQFNERTGLAIVCPLTRTDRAFPFHVAVLNDPEVTGFVMVEQVKSIDFRARKAHCIGTASESVLEEVLSILDACIY
jgi:mRNA interferase MazF